MQELDITAVLKGTSNLPIKIGELSQDIIDLLALNQKPRDIIMSIERIYHCDMHKNDYESISSYDKSLKLIPEIIHSPDFINLNTKNNSINYIKKIDDLTLVAIKIVAKGSLQFRTMFPITPQKLEYNLKLGKYLEVKKKST